MEDNRRELHLVYRNGREKSLYFNDFSELKARADLDLKGVKSARVMARWPRDSVMGHDSNVYVEVQDAKKYLKKLGFAFQETKPLLREEKKEAPKPEKQKPSEEKRPESAEEEKPKTPRENGIYLERDAPALIHYDGVEFEMPLLKRGKLYSTESHGKSGYDAASGFRGITKSMSHRFDCNQVPEMVGLDRVLKTAREVGADMVAFTPAPKQANFPQIGTYTFLDIVDESAKYYFREYGTDVLEKRLEARVTSPTA